MGARGSDEATLDRSREIVDQRAARGVEASQADDAAGSTVHEPGWASLVMI